MIDRERVKEVLRAEVAPRLAMDGGGIELVDVTAENVVKVRLKGACQGCPGARMTLQMAVERVLKESVPEIAGVEAV